MNPLINARPAGVTLDNKQALLKITWSDGAECDYPLSHLREACPCVECRGGHSRMGSQFDPDNILKLTPKRSYTVKDLHMVGNYALQPVWDDDHNTGIYTWDYLRKLCPDPDKS
jgi:DUF971 family protein